MTIKALKGYLSIFLRNQKQHEAVHTGSQTIYVLVCTCVMNFLCDVDPLPVRQTSIDWRSCGRSQRWVECIDVKAQMDRPLFSVQECEKPCVSLWFTSIQTLEIIST